MGIDASIPLAAGNIQGSDPNQLMSMLQFATQVKQQRAAADKQNALLQIFADPNNVDETTGGLKPEANRKVLAVDPVMGMKLQDNALDAKVKKAQLDSEETEAGRKKWEFGSSVAGAAVDAYEEVKNKGGSDADAISAAEETRNSLIKNNGGILHNDDKDRMLGTPIGDISEIKRFASTNKDWTNLRHQAKTEENADRRADQMDQREINREADADKRFQLQMKHDSQMQFNADRRFEQMMNQNAPPDMNDPADKQYIESIANYKVRPPSASRNPMVRQGIVKAALAVNPDYDETKFDMRQKAQRDFGTGKQGDTARSLNVSVAHLDTLRELGNALDNGDVKLINAVKQRWQEEFGTPAPTNFDTAKAIVADEVAKGVIGGASAQSDRDKLAESLRRERGHQAINGAIDTFQTLLGGQLGGLRKQYERTTGAKDFDKSFLDERTVKALEGRENNHAPAAAPHAAEVKAVASKAEYDALPKGAVYSKPGDPPGSHRVKQ